MTPLVNALYKSVITAADSNKKKELGRGFIQQGGLTPLEAWLPIFIKARKEKALLKLLTILDELPITVKEIKTPSTLGKSVTMVSKDEVVGEAIKKNARDVIAKWKGLLKAGVTRYVSADNQLVRSTNSKQDVQLVYVSTRKHNAHTYIDHTWILQSR